ncbi:MAG: YkgJ family cysteine cluster protein [Thermodesulfobacteriota bacterium]
MKIVPKQDVASLPGQRLGESDTFCFSCKPGISCFNLCCRNLTLFLYPYDLIRLTRRLSIGYEEFLDRHAEVVLREGSHFPEVLLRMAENEERTCPFLTDAGCSVYPDRPYSCRTFPTEHGFFSGPEGKAPVRMDLFRPPDYCRGQDEGKTWTVQEWLENQGAVVYVKMMARWSGYLARFTHDPWGPEGRQGRLFRMAFTAAYNMDAFREFVFKSSLLERVQVPATVRKKIKKDDAALWEFGMDWMARTLFGAEAAPKKP